MKTLLLSTNNNLRLFCVCFSLFLVGVTDTFAQANPRFSAVDPANDQLTITNYGDMPVDISSYQLCLGRGTYRTIVNEVPPGIATTLMPNASIDVTYDLLQVASGGLGLYSSGAFTNPDALEDFVQWGVGGAEREPIAVSAGIWTMGEFIDEDGPYTYIGDGSQNGSSFWSAAVMNVEGGTISGGPFEFDVDGTPDMVSGLSLTGNVGANSTYVITDDQLNILGLPPTLADVEMVDFDGAQAGVCLIWHVSFNGELEGAEEGLNAANIMGDFDLSDSIRVTRTSAVAGGEIAGGSFEFVVDGKADFIPENSIELTRAVGQNSSWVITDDQLNILGLPPTLADVEMVDFDGAQAGVCLIWHISFNGELEGAEVDLNAANITGDFDLSNSITVTRNNEVNGGEIVGGPFEFCAGDQVADMVSDITLSGNIGSNSTWVVTDDQLKILGLPPTLEAVESVDFEGAGGGVCLIWHLSFDGELEGAEVDLNAADITGNFDLSNFIEVTRIGVNGGTLTGGPFTFTQGDNMPDMVSGITLADNEGSNSTYVITDADGTILGAPADLAAVEGIDFDGEGLGVCLIWHLSYEDGVSLDITNASELEGCFSLSNSITVSRASDANVNGGMLEGGPFTFCVGDGDADNIGENDITLTGDVGSVSQWVITDDQNTILGLPPSFTAVNFDEAGGGVCRIWHLSHDGSLGGAVMGANAATDLSGNFSLSTNWIDINRTGVNAGELQIVDTGATEATICADDGAADPIAVEFVDDSVLEGGFQTWVVTDAEGNILMTPQAGPFDFEGAGPGICNIWYLSVADQSQLEGVTNASQLGGCFDLAGPIAVTRLEGADCETLSTEEFNTGLSFTVFPVPADTELQVSLTEFSANVTLGVFDLLGKKVLQKTNVSSTKAAINVSELATGSYILAVDNGLGGKATKMFTVR